MYIELTTPQKQRLLSLGLIGLMLITRYQHFGSCLSLADATLAIFFSAGYCQLGYRFIYCLMLSAAAIDVMSIALLKINSSCISPAYPFALLSYLALYCGGYYLSYRQSWSYWRALGVVSGSVLLAFMIANSSFYLWSGHSATLSAYDYFLRVAPYYWHYLSTTGTYLLGFVAFNAMVRSISHYPISRYLTIRS